MRPVHPPILDCRQVYDTCISKTRDPLLKQRFEDAADRIEEASLRFAHSVANGESYRLVASSFKPENGGLGESLEITTAELKGKLYDDRMAKAGSPGRPIYDRIKLSAPNGLCPLCGVRQVDTLDHYLPKAVFPALAVTPLNLIPACPECNKAKSDKVATSEAEQTLHPYFDDISQFSWLGASVEQTDPVRVSFFVRQDPGMSTTLFSRCCRHFSELKLASLYGFHANGEIRGIRHRLAQQFSVGGEAFVRDDLADSAQSHDFEDRNGWRAVMYHALADSAWFCREGLFL